MSGRHTHLFGKLVYKKYKKYYKRYKKIHYEKYAKYFKAYNNNPVHKEKRLARRLKIKKLYPWRSHWLAAKRRCRDKKLSKNYIGKGIKFNLTLEETKILWFRDKAYLLKLPVLHRKENKGNYCFDNCEFWSCARHSKYHQRIKWKLPF